MRYPCADVDNASEGYRCRANVEHIGQSRPDFGLGFQVKVLQVEPPPDSPNEFRSA